MNRSEFMAQLEKLLSDISQSEREEALQYYNDYFNDAGEENEADVIKALGTPEQVAEKVKEGLNDTKVQGEFTEQGYTSDTASAQKNEIIKTENAQSDNDNSDSAAATKKAKKQLPAWAIILIVAGSMILISIIITVIMAIRAIKIAKHVAVIGSEKVEEIIDETKPLIEDYLEDAKNNIPGNIAEYIGAAGSENDNGEMYHSENMEFDASEIKKLDIQFGVGKLTVKQKETYDDVIEVRIEGDFYNSVGKNADGDTLVLHMDEHMTDTKIKSGMKGFKNNVEILLPHRFIYEEAKFDLGACDATISDIDAKKLIVSIGAGNLNIDTTIAEELDLEVGAGKATANMYVNDADIEVGMGTLDFNGGITGNLKLDCGMGVANFLMSDNMTDHNYKVDCALGAVAIGNESFKSVDKKYIDNNASSEYDISCGVGAVNIQFKE